MPGFALDELDRIAAADDLHIAPFREDGSTPGTPTWIWSVVVDGALYVRAYNGVNSRWYTELFASYIGDWDAGMPFAHIPQPIVPVKPERFMLSVPDNQNATMVLRQDVPLNDRSEDYPALMMANYLLGSGGNSRLWKRIREGEGLSYDVRTQVDWGTIDVHSEWNATAIFAPQNQPKVEKAFKEELARALKDGFTAQELAEGQRGLLNYRRLGRAQDASIVGGWVRNLYVGQTFKRSAEVDAKLGSLTLDEVNAALRKYVKPDAYVAAFAGDFKP